LFTSPWIALWTIYHQHVWHLIQHFIEGETEVF